MGRRGFPAAPGSVKLALGETRPSRVNFLEPSPRRHAPSMPKDMDDGAKAVWRRVLREMGHTEVIRAADADVLRCYCEAVSQYHLNQSVTDTEDPWMPLDDWQACEGDPVFRTELRTYAVVRIAHDHRAAAVAVVQRQGERVALRVRTFPEAPLPEGEYLPAAVLEGHLRDLRRRYPAQVLATYRTTPSGRELTTGRPGPEFSYHGSFFEGSAQILRQERLVMVDVPSTPERITPAAETLMSLVTSRALVHDGDAELAAQMRNVLARPAPKGWAIEAAVDTRTHESRRIVAAQAAMLAVHRAMTAPAAPSRAMSFGEPRR